MFDILTKIGSDALECNILVSTKTELETRGWGQGAAQNSKGQVCLMGAFFVSPMGEYNPNALEPRRSNIKLFCDIIMAYLEPLPNKPEFGALPLIPYWNDRPERTYEDVINLLDKAIADRGGFV